MGAVPHAWLVSRDCLSRYGSPGASLFHTVHTRACTAADHAPDEPGSGAADLEGIHAGGRGRVHAGTGAVRRGRRGTPAAPGLAPAVDVLHLPPALLSKPYTPRPH